MRMFDPGRLAAVADGDMPPVAGELLGWSAKRTARRPLPRSLWDRGSPARSKVDCRMVLTGHLPCLATLLSLSGLLLSPLLSGCLALWRALIPLPKGFEMSPCPGSDVIASMENPKAMHSSVSSGLDQNSSSQSCARFWSNLSEQRVLLSRCTRSVHSRWGQRVLLSRCTRGVPACLLFLVCLYTFLLCSALWEMQHVMGLSPPLNPVNKRDWAQYPARPIRDMGSELPVCRNGELLYRTEPQEPAFKHRLPMHPERLGAQPTFTKSPVDMIGVSGGVVSFVCQATGDPKPRVTWNKKGKRVNSQRIETIEFDEGAGAVLRIQPLRAPRDENIYECVAENIEGEVSVQAKLTIIRGPQKMGEGLRGCGVSKNGILVRHTLRPSGSSGEEDKPGVQVPLEAFAFGVLDGVRSVRLGDAETLNNDGVQLQGVQPHPVPDTEHSGSVLRMKVASAVEDLLPPGFPNIDMGPQLKVVERTRTANMLCAASGNPDPEITWFKDFLPIDPNTSNGRIKQLRSGTRCGVALPCSNRPAFFSRAGAFVPREGEEREREREGEEDDTMTRGASDTGGGSRKGGVGERGGEVSGGSSGTGVRGGESGSALQIENTEETDQGKYECVASNVEGVRYSSPANLYVRVRRVPPRFSILPTSHEIMPGGSVNITCVAVGSPMPYVKWMLNSEDLTPEDDMPVGRNVLELNGVRESANYTCVAMSSLGIIEAVSQIIVKSLPKPPGTPLVTETTATSITITWDSGNPEPVSHYIIQYRAKTPESKFETMDSITTTRYSIGGLSPNTEYEIRVSAFNTIGQGPASEPVEARTGEQAPASPPRNIQARIISQSTMMVRWEEPEEPNGQIKGYRVYYTMDPSQPMSKWQIHNVQDSVITTIQNLVASETYTIRVLAFTSVGDGPFSDPIHVKVLQGVPGQPSRFQAGEVMDTSIQLTWEPAFEKEGIIRYELRYRESAPGSQQVTRSFGPTSSYVVEGLRANTEYHFSLAAVSNKGLGAFTNEISQKTSQAKPSAPPQEITCSSPSSTSLLVSWRPPPAESQNGVLAGYRVRHVAVGGGADPGAEPAEELQLPPASGQITLRGLEKWTLYRVTVAAATSVGPGPESPPVLCRTDEDVPGAPPRRVEVEVINSTALRVMWRSLLPGRQHGQIRGYQVHYVRVENGEARGLPLIKDVMLADAQWETDDTAEYVSTEPPSVWCSRRTCVIASPSRLTPPTSHTHTHPQPRGQAAEKRGAVMHGLLGLSVGRGQLQLFGASLLCPPACVRPRLTWVAESEYQTPAPVCDLQEMVIGGLWPDTTYSVTVAAYTTKGDGARSKPKLVATKGAVPGPPSLWVLQDSDSSAMVRWQPPASPEPSALGSELLGFRLQFGREDTLPLATLEFSAHEHEYTVSSLHRGATYLFRVSAKSRGGFGPEATRQLRVPEGAPGGYPQLTPTPNITCCSMHLSWLPPLLAERNGAITEYTLAYQEAGSTGGPLEIRLPAAQLSYGLTGLKPDSAYVIRIRAHTSVGPGPFSPPVQYRTVAMETDVPKNFTVKLVTKTTVLLAWKFSDSRFPYRCMIEYNRQKVDVDARTTRALITNLRANSTYEFRISCQENSDGVPRHRLLARTAPPIPLGRPEPDRRREPDNMPVFNLPPLEARDMIRAIYVVVVPQKKARGPRHMKSPDEMDLEELLRDGDGRSRHVRAAQQLQQVDARKPYIAASFRPAAVPPTFTLGNKMVYNGYENRALEPRQDYAVFILAELNSTGVRTFVSSPYTEILTVPDVDPQPTETGGDGLIWVVGPVLAVVFIICIVIAILLYKNSKRKESEPRTKCLLNNAEIMPHHPTDPVEMRRINFQTPDSDLNSPLTEASFDSESMMNHPPIPITELAEHTDLLKANDNLKLSQEYEVGAANRYRITTRGVGPDALVREPAAGRRLITALERDRPRAGGGGKEGGARGATPPDGVSLRLHPQSVDPGQQFTWEHSNLEVNKPKNRYANVIAYDHSRVVLAPIDGIAGSDYINANYIDGYRKQNAYIATQGPLPETFGDFWRMVWEQRAATVVMMTRLEEKSRIKCDQYWPSRATETYGMTQVTLLDTIELATFCVRTFSLHKNGSSEKREVRQFQFTAWPDHGVPEYPTPFLAFLRRVKTCNPPDAGPIIAHCSAGVGRTGCFIVIDAMLERIKHEKTVDVYGHVTLMRAQRNYMVQTEDQYGFIHDALLEAVACGNTEVAARSLFSYIQRLAQVEAGEHVTGMELEFKRLANSKAHTSRFISANLPCNKFKNRLVNIMPYETTRVCLQPIRGLEGSDYINASFIDGYRQQKAYIATQGPLAETTEDFWRMLWENNSTIVVMLTKLREMGREKCHQYWPAERSARYQYFVVDPMAEYNMPQYILREFKVTDARDGQSRTVRQFQFTDWPEQGVPKSGEGFIDFIGQVHKTKEQFGQDGPISVHCSAGVGRTGVFITLSIVLERMRYEGVVDIFQTVKMLRTQRPAMVQTELQSHRALLLFQTFDSKCLLIIDEYQFCYQAALEYLGSFDHYAT
ncbi:hypothetical protein P4O66_012947 [Electrophorus voltai]|uniref:protein-tyrosine-phosphatase n=1 Tax=Electrophorus voltai TaxID=2609070 RepID=A0AAD8ZVH0_9TELE|nr:hypothetical protein P4O66_012947 [Electrophorus voltai]